MPVGAFSPVSPFPGEDQVPSAHCQPRSSRLAYTPMPVHPVARRGHGEWLPGQDTSRELPDSHCWPHSAYLQMESLRQAAEKGMSSPHLLLGDYGTTQRQKEARRKECGKAAPVPLERWL